MANSTTRWAVSLVVVLYYRCCLSASVVVDAAAVPAVYVFGDSLADVGNNNELPLSLLKANFPHNGIDYPGSKATGRFSNGKNMADILAEKIGIPSSIPYLVMSSSSNKIQAFLNGISFASGGAGVLDSTNSGQCLTFNTQIDYYSSVYGDLVQHLGSNKAMNHLAKSIFAFVIGSNDILRYSRSNVANQSNPQQFVDSLVTSLRGQLKRIYNLGARKFLFVGTGPIGCCPAMRNRNFTADCQAVANTVSLLYNKGAASLLQQMKSEHGDMNYSFVDTYNVLLQLIQNPTSYGFSEVKAACCGLGNLNAKVACLPISTYCSNRKDHIFWDLYHPSETTVEILTSLVFEGPVSHVYPINVKQLIAL